jgi:molecular chaperone Hsp33
MSKKSQPIDTSAEEDFIQPFLIDHSAIHGRFVRLGSAAEEILSRHRYPKPVAVLLAEMLVVAAMLSSNLKSGGLLTVQAKGEGPVKFLVVDATHTGALRGYAELAEGGKTKLSQLARRKKPPTLKDILGKGYLALTFDPGLGGERYQGIVELADTSFADAMLGYFTQSHQVEMAIRIAAAQEKRKGRKARWVAGGILIERLPEGSVSKNPKKKSSKSPEKFRTSDGLPEDLKEQWVRNRLFLESATEKELLDRSLPSWTLIRRLFGEDGVWAYAVRAIEASCRCSRERILEVLTSLPEQEVNDLFVRNRLKINCRFCNSTEQFSRDDIKNLYTK